MSDAEYEACYEAWSYQQQAHAEAMQRQVDENCENDIHSDNGKGICGWCGKELKVVTPQENG